MIGTSPGRAELLDFEEVSSRLRLDNRVDIGRQEIPVAQVIGSVGRAHDFDRNFRPGNPRLQRMINEIRANNPGAMDQPIHVYQVHQAYFVVDGHKRMALAKADDRDFIDAEVTRFTSRFLIDGTTTIDSVRSTEEELRFREETGLLRSVPAARFPLSDADGYLDLQESVKSHAYDLSEQRGEVVPAAEAAQHWFEFIFRRAVAVAREAGYDKLLVGCSDAELFLIMRHGNRARFGPDWEMRPGLRERSLKNLQAQARPNALSPLTRRLRRPRQAPSLLPERDREAD